MPHFINQKINWKLNIIRAISLQLTSTALLLIFILSRTTPQLSAPSLVFTKTPHRMRVVSHFIQEQAVYTALDDQF